MASKVRLIDVTKCMACKGCQVACKQWNQLPAVETTFTGSYENPADFAAETWGRVIFNEYEQGNDINWYFNFSSCMHCTEAACLEICPVKAISKTALGTVKIDQEICIGCGACVSVCPFSIPRLGNGKAWKCTSCTDRVTNGMATACATACCSGAITFGTFADKTAEAEARVSELKSRGVANAQVYGVEELGGLGVIYVLADSPDKYGMPVNPQVAYANLYLWKVALGPVKTLATIGLAAGALSGWLKLRKDEVSKENGERHNIL